MEGIGGAIRRHRDDHGGSAQGAFERTRKHLGTGTYCRLVTVPSRGSARIGPNGRALLDYP